MQVFLRCTYLKCVKSTADCGTFIIVTIKVPAQFYMNCALEKDEIENMEL